MSEKTDKLKFWLKTALFVVPFAYIANFIYAILTGETGGTFGDSFGAANALFSGTALLMLVLAVILQREELAEFKEDRKDTQKILKGQKDINSAQKSALDRQVFEQTFFSLISTLSNESISLDATMDNMSYKPTVASESATMVNRITSKHKNLNYYRDLSTTAAAIPINRCLPFCLLAGVAYKLISESAIAEDAPKETYLNSLKALFDSDLTLVFGFFVLTRSEKNPELKELFSQFNLLEEIASKDFKEVFANFENSSN